MRRAQWQKGKDMPIYEKMKTKGYVVRGTPWLTDVEDVLEETGDRDFYRKTTR